MFRSSSALRPLLSALGGLLAALVTTAAGAEPPADPEWTFSWWPRMQLERSDGAHEFGFGGRFLYDVGGIYYDSDLTNLSSSPGWNEKNEVRQGRAYLKGHVFHRFEFKVEADFSPAVPSLTDAYVGVRDLGFLGTLRVGHQKLPYSLENQTSRKYLDFMERSLAGVADPSVRDLGVKLFDTARDERIHWAVGVFRDTDSSGYEVTHPATWKASTRVTGLPIWREEGRRLLHLGFSYEHEFREPDTFSLSRSPESFLADELLDTGSIEGTRDIDRFGVELLWIHGPLAVQSEFLAAAVDREGGGGLFFPGAYLQASWFLTGEHRNYLRREARIGRLYPIRDLDFSSGGWGAFQLAARVSYGNLDDGGVDGGEEINFTFGANWFPTSFTRITFNYVFGHLVGQGDVSILQARFQFSY